MPKILRWLTWMCFAFCLFVPLSLIPAGGHYINGVQVTFEEFWRRSGGPTFFLAGVLFPLCGYGFVRAQNWFRYVFAALQFALPVGTLFFGGVDWDILLGVVWAALITYYLFWRPNVREYFRANESASI
jgi:hypothetical protein